MTGDDARYPYAFDRDAVAAELAGRWASLEPGAESGVRARVAGRIVSVRAQGKAAFADLADGSGRIQLFAQQRVLGDDGMDAFGRVRVGDVVGASGEVIRTRRGELSVRVDSIEVLAPCRRPMPEKWHGVTDVETRYRKRYLDLLVNPDARRALEARARANSAIRSYMEGRGFVEVETPLLHPVASGAVARPFVTHHNALDIDLYLRVAPELYLKRLLIGNVERVYELNRSFRNEGVSARHNPEFTMLEGYEAYVDYHHTMDLVEGLVRALATAVTGSLRFVSGELEVDLGPRFRRIDMFEAIAEAGGPDLRDVWAGGDDDALRDAARAAGVRVAPEWAPGKVLMEVFEEIAERALVQPTFVTGTPRDVSPLAKDHRDIPRFTEHADLVIGGVEIAPIYSELNDPVEQRRRFEQQAAARAAGDHEAALPDEDFLEALAYAMPPAGGFGVGVDRMLTLLLDAPSIREVILFPTLRPES
ncbi:MAG TPA: lysine--tRNA ligase [Actinomycetota bacterium]|nr:lysine--tRNA ligase [Actinomycetota bacterium]